MKIIIVILSVLLAAAIYMWISKPVEIINNDNELIAKLEEKNIALQTYLNDTLAKQYNYFTEMLRYKDSVVNAKRINNWNLIIRHEKKLERYRNISTDSAFILWSIESSTDRFD